MDEEKKEDTKIVDYINITEDGGVKKKILKEGKGMLPELGYGVSINYFGRNSDNKVFDQNQDKENPFRFIIGAKQVIKGLEIAVKTMKIGEKAEFIISPDYAYGNKKISDLIPENSTLTFEIEFLSIGFNEDEISKLTYEQKLEVGKALKAKGVEKYKIKEFEQANNLFSRATNFLKNMDNNKTEEAEGVNLYLATLSNICNCFNHLKNYKKIIYYATMGLKIKNLPKLYYFRAIAYAYSDEFSESKKDFEALKNLIGKDKAEEDEGVKFVHNLINSREKERITGRKKMSKALQNLYEDKVISQNPIDPPKEQNKENPVVFLDIKIGENEPKRVEIELFKDKVPKNMRKFQMFMHR